MSLDLKAKIYNDEDAARAHLEAIQWPDGPVCPHCGVVNEATKLEGKSTRPGVYKCRPCQKPFSVTVGTVFERSKIPLTKWLLATELLTSSKKGISAHQVHRMLGVTYKTAWFMMHRIREAMKPAANAGPIGGEGKSVEVDETYIGYKAAKVRREKPKGAFHHKHAVVSLVERGGKVISFYMPQVRTIDLNDLVGRYIRRDSVLNTDESALYKPVGKRFDAHDTINHNKGEYVRGSASTNTVEGVFSIFKRGMIGTYQHCGEQHLQRYLAEFDFRYSNREKLGVNDTMRAAKALAGINGKRLTYRRSVQA